MPVLLNRLGRQLHRRNAKSTTITELYPPEPYNCTEEKQIFQHEQVEKIAKLKRKQIL